MLGRRFAFAGIAILAFLAFPAWAPAADPKPAEPVQAVEFPYYLYPRTQWERELVWLKTIGVRTVEFSIPWNWHQLRPGEFDLNGRTSPRRDLAGFVRLLRRLGLRAWIRPMPPVAGWLNRGLPPSADAHARSAWLKELAALLATQTASHGGPVAWVEGRDLAADAPPPPEYVTISLTDPAALALSREALAAGRSLLWTDVEDALYPAGWEAGTVPLLRRGAVDLAGHEQDAARALRRDAALLRNWSPLLKDLRPAPMPKPAQGKLPEGVTASELVSDAASAVSVTNTGTQPFRGEIRVLEPAGKRTLVIPDVSVPAGESLWLPVDVTLGPGGLCRECTNFSPAEHIIYATAELLSIEYENGILAMEFAAPEPGVVVLQLAREPIGPFLAAGKPTEFDYDEKNLRARLTIPAGTTPDRRVRIGIAIEEPETSGFFNDAHRLMIGQDNLVSTTFSSAELAARSRLRLPEGYTATQSARSPNEIDYRIAVPSDALHGDWVPLALEADGVPLGRARVQLLRPASVRLWDPIELHYGADAALAADPPTAVVDPKAGTNLEMVVRNNSPQIQTYRLEAVGDGLDFFPPKTEVSVGAASERRVELRVFAHEGTQGLRDWRVKLSGPASADTPFRALLLPQRQTVVWSADLDGDGAPEWVLESARVRAVFSARDGGRWMDLTWKPTDVNFLPEAGAFASAEPVEVRAAGDALEFAGKGWKRVVRLDGGTLSIQQDCPLPADGLTPGKREGAALSIARPSPERAEFTLN